MSSASAGSAWVDRYLQPQLNSHFHSRGSALRRCLQIGADDDEEANRLRENGYRCTVMLDRLEPYRQWKWYQSPVVANWRQPAFADGCFDFVFSGDFGQMAGNQGRHGEVARDLVRLVRPGGAILLSVANRYCPADLLHRESRIHGPWHGHTASLAQIERAFSALPVRIRRLNIRSHFRWSRLPRAIAPVGALLSSYLGLSSSVNHRWLYASPLNPVLMLWVEVQHGGLG